jgi:hypothetical protein
MLSVNGYSLQRELHGIELDDARLNRRSQELIDSLGAQPEAPINQACQDWQDTKAAYPFFANENTTRERIGESHYKRTAERAAQRGWVLAVQGTSFLNYSHHPKTQELGAIGNKKQKQRGFGMHSTLALAPSGLPLGLLDQRWLERSIDEPSYKPNEIRRLPIEAKESNRWLQAMRQAEDIVAGGAKLVHVCDAEADIYEFFTEFEQRDRYFLVRAGSNRCLLQDKIEMPSKLWPYLELQPLLGERAVAIRGNQMHKGREATVSVRTAAVTLKPPYRPVGRRLPPLTMTAILLREENPPAEIDEPIEWLLLTNLPLKNKGEVLRAADWFGLRWQIEDFHKILKSGCKVEECRLQTAGRLQKYSAMMSIVAWHLHMLTYLSRTQPSAPCTEALTTVEWEALYMRIHNTAVLSQTVPTVYQAIQRIAQLGGFLGRKGDGEPGITTIWRGWRRLQNLAATWHIVKERAH